MACPRDPKDSDFSGQSYHNVAWQLGVGYQNRMLNNKQTGRNLSDLYDCANPCIMNLFRIRAKP